MNITISKKEYNQLLEDQALLNALREAGVDNWEGYSIALRSLDDECCGGECGCRQEDPDTYMPYSNPDEPGDD